MTPLDPTTVRTATRVRNDRTTKQAAFIVEALVLLVFILASMAVLMQLFGSARTTGIEAHDLSQAIVLASNSAEKFAATPAEGATETFFVEEDGALRSADGPTDDAFSVTCTVEGEQREGGTLYRAHIFVERHGSELYELESSRYVSEAAALSRKAAS
ncbi:type IV pilus modification PilV family protein [Raoultibacter timonensis]|uniref:type IV pilus modification PilV family protein n=1 Tax=Raoultibacter timonensis TaxID=1907662 RepID=UPI0026DABDA7|nr:hypothetical protein [Raoultibacter timonensis]